MTKTADRVTHRSSFYRSECETFVQREEGSRLIWIGQGRDWMYLDLEEAAFLRDVLADILPTAEQDAEIEGEE